MNTFIHFCSQATPISDFYVHEAAKLAIDLTIRHQSEPEDLNLYTCNRSFIDSYKFQVVEQGLEDLFDSLFIVVDEVAYSVEQFEELFSTPQFRHEEESHERAQVVYH